MSSRAGIRKGLLSVFLGLGGALLQKRLDAHETLGWILWCAIGVALLFMWKPWKILGKGWHEWFRQEVLSATTAAEWKDLAVRFEALPPHIWAEWYSESYGFDGELVGEQWLFRQDPDKTAASLCMLAGRMLLRSPKLGPGLSQKVKTRSDDASRWLYYLDEALGAKTVGDGTSTARRFTVKTEVREIKPLGQLCANGCRRCAALEI